MEIQLNNQQLSNSTLTIRRRFSSTTLNLLNIAVYGVSNMRQTGIFSMRMILSTSMFISLILMEEVYSTLI